MWETVRVRWMEGRGDTKVLGSLMKVEGNTAACVLIYVVMVCIFPWMWITWVAEAVGNSKSLNIISRQIRDSYSRKISWRSL